ncbi:hypothetical protein IF129_13535 [Streptomyces chumphonensis]|uniref:Uncharacterized protein n=1 Tax=Streptomyces chumphonensis TaxID=1214925 RepID=A0A927F1M5_9ACTN|nr:hypothetical protein [Streptomyces chumphonensis]MBD3932569.1 hypothetical protein [Streptomyces chumphonensis]
MLDVPDQAHREDPLAALAALRDYVSRLPLSEFEQSDWFTLHSDLVSFLADVLIRGRGAEWNVKADPSVRRGYRYVIQATGLDGAKRQIDPYDVVEEEFRHLPIEITRMIANAEVALAVVRIHES